MAKLFKNLTKQAKMVRYLGLKRFTRTEGPSRKYIVMVSPSGENFYLGKSGAVRRGPSIAKSWSLTDKVDWPEIDKFLQQGETVTLLQNLLRR